MKDESPLLALVPDLRGGFYNRLIRASSGNRHRLEDFLTEVVGEILLILAGDPESLLWFVREYFFKTLNEENLRRWEKLVSAFKSFDVRTQCTIDIDATTHKRPDIVVFGDRVPILVIECKVAAGFTSSEIDLPEGRKIISQLQWYDSWLNRNSPKGAALVVLTQYADPPATFYDDRIFSTSIRNICRWSDLFKFLQCLMVAEEGRAKIIFRKIERVLPYFLEFMKENRLMIPNLTPNDLAAARLYLGGYSHRKLLNCVDGVSKSVRPILKSKKFSRLDGKADVIEEEDGVYIVDKKTKGKITIGWGFWFSTSDIGPWRKEYDPPWKLSEGLMVFVDFDKLPHRPSGSNFKSWIFPISAKIDDYGVYKVTALSGILGEDNASDLIADWLVAGINDALELIEAIE